MHHRETFNEVADLYQSDRPGYPDALFADLVAVTDLTPGDRILEVGCGTGQATEALARTGSPLVAIDPGPELIRAARDRLAGYPNVELTISSFESWPLEPAGFALLAAAQAWHWVDPTVAFGKAAQALEPRGWLAIFGNVPLPPPSPFLEAFEPIYALHAPELLQGPAPETWYLPNGPVADLYAQSGLFEPVLHRAYTWTHSLDDPGLIRLMGTISYYNLLPASQREALFAAVAAAVAERGGRIDLAYQSHLYLARKRA